MPTRLLTRLPALALAVVTIGCVGTTRDSAAPLAPRFSACDAEMRAFVAVTRLARQHGEDWTLFEPAIEAMKEQVVDCVQDGYPAPQPI